MAAAPPPTYLDGVVVRLARLCVRPVRHEPGLQQVLVKAVPQSSYGRVICRDRRREDELPGAGEEEFNSSNGQPPSLMSHSVYWTRPQSDRWK